MTRKDYELIAGVLRSTKPSITKPRATAEEVCSLEQWEDTVREFSTRLRRESEFFDQSRFLAACGYGED